MCGGVMGAEAGTADRSDVCLYGDCKEPSPRLGSPGIIAIPVKDANFTLIWSFRWSAESTTGKQKHSKKKKNQS